MTRREFKKKHNALSLELQKILRSKTKAIQFLLNLNKTYDMLIGKIKELEKQYYGDE
jgi:hypothetical protein